MADYAEMYKHLFRSVIKAIEILQVAQQETEEIYLSAEKPNITLILPEQIADNNDDDQL